MRVDPLLEVGRPAVQTKGRRRRSTSTGSASDESDREKEEETERDDVRSRPIRGDNRLGG